MTPLSWVKRDPWKEIQFEGEILLRLNWFADQIHLKHFPDVKTWLDRSSDWTKPSWSVVATLPRTFQEQTNILFILGCAPISGARPPAAQSGKSFSEVDKPILGPTVEPTIRLTASALQPAGFRSGSVGWESSCDGYNVSSLAESASKQIIWWHCRNAFIIETAL